MYGIYIHIPFCLKKCPYCDFYSVCTGAKKRHDYVKALENQILSFSPVEADSVYFGGGTPSLLDPSEIKEIIDTVRKRHKLREDAEISMELNPATADADKLRAFREAGINRLSIGCQSFNDGILKALGRLHSAGQALETVRNASAAGFEDISVDLMLAVPFQTPEIAAEDARTAVSMPEITHISAYLLKICEGTPFAEGVDGLPSDDTAADCYTALSKVLSDGGFSRYEISNFSRGNHPSRHNLKYWECGQWLGLGPGAHMSDGLKRYSNPSDLKKFIEVYGASPVADPISYMDEEGSVDAEEYIITSLRTAKGMDLPVLRERFGASLAADTVSFIERLKADDYVLFDGKTLTLTEKGMLVSNAIISGLI